MDLSQKWKKNSKIVNYTLYLSIVLLIFIGFWLRFVNLGEINFQNDEYFHVETAVGYMETGEFVMWDFLNKEPAGDYIRAFPYTWLVAHSFGMFGINEFAGRLWSLIFGVLLLPLVYLLGWRITKSRFIGLLSLLMVVFDQSLIWSSRVCRMYSMFVFFSLTSTWLIYKGLEGKKHKYFNLYYLIPGGLLFIFSYFIHEATFALGLGFLVYFLIRAFQNRATNRDKPGGSSEYKILSLIGLVSIALFFVVHYFVTPLTTNEFFTIRFDPNFEYFKYPFNQLHVSYLVGWAVLILGLFLWNKRNNIKIYYLSLFAPLIIYFVFFANRYPAKKYILFVIPFILIFYIDGLYNLVKKVMQPKYFYVSLLITFLLLGPIFSWPSIAVDNLFWQTARADHNYNNFDYHNYKDAYKYIEDNYKDGQPVLIQHKRGYYFINSDIKFISLKADKEYTLKEFKDVLRDYNSGWVVWPKYKQYHIQDKIVEYCEQELNFVKEVENTNVVIYKWKDKF